MDDSVFRVRIDVDVSSLGKIPQAANTAATAAEQMGQRLKASGLNAEEAASALANLGFTSTETAAALGTVATTAAPASVATEAIGPAARAAATGLQSTSVASAQARVELAALTGSAGAAEFGLARLAARSTTLSPIISAAFPVLGALALVEIIGTMASKVYEVYQNYFNLKNQVDEVTEATKRLDEATYQLGQDALRSHVEFTKIVAGPVAAAKEELENLTSKVYKIDVDEKQIKDLPQWVKDFIESMKTAPGQIGVPAEQIAAQISRVQQAIAEAQQRAKSMKLEAADTEDRGGASRIIEQQAKELEIAGQLFTAIQNQLLAAQRDYAAKKQELDAQVGAAQSRESNERLREMIDDLRKQEEAERKALELRKKLAEEELRIEEAKAKAFARTQRAFEEDAKLGQSLELEKARESERSAEEQVAAFDTGSKERIDTYAAEVEKLKAMQSQALQTMLAHQSQSNSAAASIDAELYNQLGAMVAEFQRKYMEASRERTNQDRREALERLRTETESSIKDRDESGEKKVKGIEETAADVKAMGRASQESMRDVIASLKAIEIEKQRETEIFLQADRDQLEAELAVQRAMHATPQDLDRTAAQIASIDRKILASHEELTTKLKRLDQDAALAQMQSIQRVAQMWAADWTRMINEVLTGRQKIGTAIVQMGAQIELQLIDKGIAKVVTKWGEQLLTLLAEHIGWLAKLLGVQIAGNAQQVAAQKAANLAMVSGDAAVGFAAAYASVIQALPFPENVATAPEVASSVAAAIGAGGLPSAAGGMDVMHDTLAQVHKKEMILPAPLADRVRSMTAAAPSGGDHHTWNIDARGNNESDIKKLFDLHLVPKIKRAVRDGKIA